MRDFAQLHLATLHCLAKTKSPSASRRTQLFFRIHFLPSKKTTTSVVTRDHFGMAFGCPFFHPSCVYARGAILSMVPDPTLPTSSQIRLHKHSHIQQSILQTRWSRQTSEKLYCLCDIDSRRLLKLWHTKIRTSLKYTSISYKGISPGCELRFSKKYKAIL